MTCIFCGGGGTPGNRMSAEHAIPQWVRDVLPGGTEPNWLTGRTRSRKITQRSVGRAATVRFKVVCSSCNNGWMSVLEQEARPLLTDLILDERTDPLGPGDFSLLSRWAFKTAAVIDRMPGPVDTPRLPPEPVLRFGTSSGQDLPSLMTVVLARSTYAEARMPGSSRVTDTYVYHWGYHTPGGDIWIGRFVIRIGHLVLVVFLQYGDGSWDYDPLGPSRDFQIRAVLRRIWPLPEATIRFDSIPPIQMIGGIGGLAGENFIVTE